MILARAAPDSDPMRQDAWKKRIGSKIFKFAAAIGIAIGFYPA